MIPAGGTHEIAGLAAPSAERESAVAINRARHLVLQAAGAILVVLATNWVIPFTPPQSDASVYLLLARDLKYDGGSLYRTEPETSLHFPPGYPWLLSFFVERDSLGWAPIVQRVFHGLTIALGSIWATLQFGTGVGWLVFALLAINPAFLGSSSMLRSEAPHAVFYLVGFIAWFRFIQTRKSGPLVLCALVLALANYVRSYGLLLAAILPVLIVIALRAHPWRRTLGYVALFVGTWLLVMAPWAVRNYLLYEQFIPMTMPGSTMYSAWFPPGKMQFGMMANDEVTREASTVADPFDRDKFFREATVKRILADPVFALETTARKYAFYVMPFDWEFFGWFNEAGRQRPSLHFVYVFMLPFALLFIWQHRREEAFWLGYMAPILFGLLMTALILGIPRFRLCIEPFLTVFAAVYLVQWISANPRWRGAVAGSYFLACLAGAYGFAQLVR